MALPPTRLTGSPIRGGSDAVWTNKTQANKVAVSSFFDQGPVVHAAAGKASFGPLGRVAAGKTTRTGTAKSSFGLLGRTATAKTTRRGTAKSSFGPLGRLATGKSPRVARAVQSFAAFGGAGQGKAAHLAAGKGIIGPIGSRATGRIKAGGAGKASFGPITSSALSKAIVHGRGSGTFSWLAGYATGALQIKGKGRATFDAFSGSAGGNSIGVYAYAEFGPLETISQGKLIISATAKSSLAEFYSSGTIGTKSVAEAIQSFLPFGTRAVGETFPENPPNTIVVRARVREIAVPQRQRTWRIRMNDNGNWTPRSVRDNERYTVDWSKELGANTILDSVVSSDDPEMVIDRNTHVGEYQYFWISGGRRRNTATITCTITTSDGRTLDETNPIVTV